MSELTGKYIEDHLVNTHTEDSWARAILEIVLSEAIKQLGNKSAEEVVIDAKFRVTAVQATGSDPITRSSGCIRTCVVVSPTGREVCYHKPALM